MTLLDCRLWVLVVGLSSLSPAIATAASTPSQTQRQEHLKYPAPAAEFREHVSERIAGARERLDEYIVNKGLRPEEASALRARFQAGVAQVNAKVDEVCADGTVTADEAKAVHELAKSLRRDWDRQTTRDRT
jgi:hypothetical protein